MAGLPTDRATAVRPGEELDVTALEAFFATVAPELAGPVEIGQFPHGYSHLTYRVRVAGRDLVLRRPPPGANVPSGHDVGREYRILSALDGLYDKAPKPLVACADPSVLGGPFYLMERVEGVVLRGCMASDEVPSEELMAAIADSLVRTLVELHGLDATRPGLCELGRPQGYVRRQIEGWTERWRAARTDEVAAMEKVARWLLDSMPDHEDAGGRRAALVHNDFKYDNLVLDAADPARVRAVLDWEMATVGDPLMDLGTMLGYWIDADDPEELHKLALSPTTLPGNPERAEVAQRYTELGGTGLDGLVFYYVYGVFKLAVIIQQIYARYLRGHTRDPRFASLLDGVRGCGLTAARSIDLQRIDRLLG